MKVLNLYPLDLIPHLQEEALQYLVSQSLCMGFVLGNVWVIYLSCVMLKSGVMGFCLPVV